MDMITLSRSPVIHSPQVGAAITKQYLSAAFNVLANESFRYVREIIGSRDAALEFEDVHELIKFIAESGFEMLYI